MTRTEESDEIVNLKNLVADCTCPVCQEVFVQPHKLKCQHTFCHNCYHKMCRKLRGRSRSPDGLLSLAIFRKQDSDASLQCPICREKFNSSEPINEDNEAVMLVQTLNHIKSQLCQEPDCWKWPDVTCPCCQIARCREHHLAKVEELVNNCNKLCGEIEAFANFDDNHQQLEKLKGFEEQLKQLEGQMLAKIQAKAEECKAQLSSAEEELTRQDKESEEARNSLNEALTKLKDSIKKEDVLAMSKSYKLGSEQLANVRQKFPVMEVASSFKDSEFLLGFDGLLAQVRIDTLVRPYVGLGPELKPCRVKRTPKLEPWDLCLLVNCAGVYVDGESLSLKPQPGQSQLAGPCLFVNFKGFVSKRLHVYDVDAVELATVKLEMKSGEMPGKFFVCNQRQLIYASDPGKHEVFVFKLTGELVKRFGGKGRDAGEFDEPMSLFTDSNLLYVVDSENKRLQIFNIEDNYSHAYTLEHPQFTNHVHSVFVGASCIAVSDRERKRIFTFDKATRQPLVDVGLEGQPFDMTADRFGNVLVSLTKERKVQVMDSSATRCISTFSLQRSGGKSSQKSDSAAAAAAAAASSSSSSDEPLLMLTRRKRLSVIHGLALATDRSRLFVSDTFRRAILVFDL